MGPAAADGTLQVSLASMAASRQLDRTLLPSAAAEAIFDKKKRPRGGADGKFGAASALRGSTETNAQICLRF